MRCLRRERNRGQKTRGARRLQRIVREANRAGPRTSRSNAPPATHSSMRSEVYGPSGTSVRRLQDGNSRLLLPHRNCLHRIRIAPRHTDETVIDDEDCFVGSRRRVRDEHHRRRDESAEDGRRDPMANRRAVPRSGRMHDPFCLRHEPWSSHGGVATGPWTSRVHRSEARVWAAICSCAAPGRPLRRRGGEGLRTEQSPVCGYEISVSQRGFR